MGISPSAVARGSAITTKFVDLAGGAARSLPQRITIIGQGNENASYPLDKFAVTTGANQVGQTVGYNCPLYFMAEELFPANGGGVGNIPVDVIPLDAGAGAAPSAGSILPSGTTTDAGTYWVEIAGKLSQPFVVPAGTVDPNLVINRMFTAVNSKLGMAMTAEHSYGTLVSTPDGGNTGDGTVTGLAVSTGQQPLAGKWSLTCNLGGVSAVFTLTDPEGVVIDSNVVAASHVDLGGLDFTLTYGTADYIVGDTFEFDVPATNLALTSGWNDANANDITVRVLGPAPSIGAVFSVTQPTGGAGGADYAQISKVGPVWTTMVGSGTNIADTPALDAFKDWGLPRWDGLVHTPAVCFTGRSASDPSIVVNVSSTRSTDLINSQVTVPGTNSLPCSIAAAHIAKIALVANTNPAHDYGSQDLSSIEPGSDADQWDYAQRDFIVKGGASTTEKVNNVVTISDVITMYAPMGEEPPAYRYVVDIVKLQNVIYNIDLEFGGPSWDGKPLIADGQPTTNPEARTPGMATAALAAIVDGLALEAILADPTRAKASIDVSIDPTNGKRLNMSLTVQLAGNTNIRDINLNFGFFFGS